MKVCVMSMKVCVMCMKVCVMCILTWSATQITTHLRVELQLLRKVCFAATALFFSLCPLSPPSSPHLIAQRRPNGAKMEVRDNHFGGVTYPRNNSTVSAAVSSIIPFITTNYCRTGLKKNLLEGSVIESSVSCNRE